MARGADRTSPGIFRKEKENGNAKHDRWWALGAWINPEGNLEIRREAESPYLNVDNNKCLVLYQNDTESNPGCLEIINTGRGHPIALRDTPGGTLTGYASKSGAWVDPSSADLKDDFKKMSDQKAEKVIEGLESRSYVYKTDREQREFGPTAEDFKSATGLGNGTHINGNTLAGLVLRLVQFVWKRQKALEAKVELITSSAPEA